MSICLFKSQATMYKLQKSDLQFKLMQNIHERDDIKERLDYFENMASTQDEAEAMKMANNGESYTKNIAIKQWHDSAEYKQLIAEDTELDVENSSIETELEFIDSMIDQFEDGEHNEIKNSGLWCFGG